jgi:hypothetical protein
MRLASLQLSGYFAFSGYHHVDEKEEYQRPHIRERYKYSQLDDRDFGDLILGTAQTAKGLWARSQNREKENISFVMCLSVLLSAWNISATAGSVFMKFDYF